MPQTTDFLTLTSRTSAKKTQLAVPAVTRIVQSSTVTSKGQTTIPKAVRDALSLTAGSSVSFEIGAKGVSIFNSNTDRDPVITAFLDFLERDMAKNPENIKPLSEALYNLAGDTDVVPAVNIDDEILGDVAL